MWCYILIRWVSENMAKRRRMWLSAGLKTQCLWVKWAKTRVKTERLPGREQHKHTLTCFGSGLLSTNECVIGLSRLLAAPQLQLTEKLTCKGRAGVTWRSSGMWPSQETGLWEGREERRVRSRFDFWGLRETGEREKDEGFEKWRMMEEKDGIHCDRGASQTLLASWWLHCTLGTQTNRAAGSIHFNVRLPFSSLTPSPPSVLKIAAEPLPLVQTNTKTCLKTREYNFPWP